MEKDENLKNESLNKVVIFASFYIAGVISFFTHTEIFVALFLLVLTLFGLIKNLISNKSAIIFYLIFVVALINCHYQIENHDDLSKFIPSKAVITGTVLSIPTTNNAEKTKFYLKAESGTFDGIKVNNLNAKTIVTLVDTQENISKIKIADKIELRGKLRNPMKAKNPSQFDYSNYLKNHGVFSTFYVKNSGWKILQAPDSFCGKFLQKLNDTRTNILNHQKKYVKTPNIEVLGGIVFGDDAINPPDYIKDSFINSGLLHILAASGMNVSIIFGLWYFIGRRLRLNYRLVVLTGALLVAFYTLMTGMGPSVLRAAIMIEFIILGKLIDRSANSISLIFLVAFLMLLYDPRMINDVGFQLSFVVTFALIFYCPPVLSEIKNKIVEVICGAILIPFVAQLWAAPIQMFYFNTFATYSVLANLVISPFIGVISFLGFLSSILAMIPIEIFADKVCMIFSWVLNPVVTVVVKVSDYFAALPNSLLTTVHPDIFQIILYYSILLIVGFLIKEKFANKKLLGTVLILFMLFVVSFAKVDKKELEIIVFDVGNADSFLIKTPNNKYIMIDTAHGVLEGSLSSFSQTDAIMNKYMKDRGIKNLELLLLTHFDSDHSGGAVDIMKSTNSKKVVLNKNKDNSKTTKKIYDYLSKNKINTVYAENNKVLYNEENLNLTTYNPNFKNNKNDNDNSTVSLLSYKDFDMLFMADAGVKSFNKIKKDLRKNDIEILKSGHHGANNTVSKEMLKEIKADNVIISTGYNSYGHPTKQTLKILSKSNVKIYRTDIDNAIKITSDGINYKIYKYDTVKRKFVLDTEKPCITAIKPAGN